MSRDTYDVMALTARLWRAGRLAGPPPSCARPTRPRPFALTARTPQPDFETEVREIFRQREQETLAGGHRVDRPLPPAPPPPAPPPPAPEPVDAQIVRLQRELKSAKTQLRRLREEHNALKRDQGELARFWNRVANERVALRATTPRHAEPTSAFLLGVAYGLRWLTSEPHWPAPHRMGLVEEAGQWHLRGPDA